MTQRVEPGLESLVVPEVGNGDRTEASAGPWAEGAWQGAMTSEPRGSRGRCLVERAPREPPALPSPLQARRAGPPWPVQLGESTLDLHFPLLEDNAGPKLSLSLCVWWRRELKALKEDMVDLQG